jgi:RNA polymerase sigma-70 factor (ECF subfamily)
VEQVTMALAAYEDEFTRYRRLLFSIAYRMLGTVTDAEDMVQETYLRWRRAHDEGAPTVAAPKSWLTTTITRLSIDHLRSARVRREEYVGPWLPEPILTSATDDDPAEGAALADTLSLAFLVVLERLNPIERAVFLLHDVFGYDFAEIASIVGKSAPNCRQLARRAREHVAANRPRFAPDTATRERLLGEFMRACTSGDLPGLIDILADDITVWSDGGGKIQAARKPVHGAQKVAGFLLKLAEFATLQGATYRLAEINGQPGMIALLGEATYSVMTFDIADDRIAGIAVVVNPEKLNGVSR